MTAKPTVFLKALLPDAILATTLAMELMVVCSFCLIIVKTNTVAVPVLTLSLSDWLLSGGD